MKQKKMTHRCCICGKEFSGYGNNPDPLKNYNKVFFKRDDVCCNECNDEFVLDYRLCCLTNDIKALKIQREVTKRIKSWKILTVTVERLDGTSYEQELELSGSVDETISKFQKTLGKGYIVVAWRAGE